MTRSFGERVAMNSPIQGTAADIIKIAMIRVNDKLKALKLRSRLILQIHDELLIETATEEIESVRKLLQEEMQHAAELLVSLEVDVNEGPNWYEAK
jgi:DNA polymerase-1